MLIFIDSLHSTKFNWISLISGRGYLMCACFLSVIKFYGIENKAVAISNSPVVL